MGAGDVTGSDGPVFAGYLPRLPPTQGPAVLTEHRGTPHGDGTEAQPPQRRGGRRRRWPGRLHKRVPRWLRVVVAVIALTLLVPAISLGRALTASNNLTVGERAAEWMRDNHMGGALNKVENWWFTRNAPKAGGEPDRSIAVGDPSATAADAATAPHLPGPVAVAVPDGVAPVPHEGEWQPVGREVGGAHAMYTTQVRPDSVHTSLLAGLTWMDPQLVRFELHPGTSEPGAKWSQPSQVPAAERLDLMAAFNSGFRMQDARGGFYLDGQTKGQLRDGAASFVVYADGSATVGKWGRDVAMTPDVVAVRQNLDLIIDNGGGAPNLAGKPAADPAPGVPADGLDDNSNGAWGDTLGNKVLVWRSGVCVTSTGALVYGYGDGLGALSLSELMMRSGCVRAMELDINKSWMTFNTYDPSTAGDPASVHGVKLLPEQSKGADRYLSPDARDFVAGLARTPSTSGPATASGTSSPAPSSPSTTAPRKSSRTPPTVPKPKTR